MILAASPDNSLPSSPRMVMAPSEDLSVALRRMALEQLEVVMHGFRAEDDDAVLDNNVHLARKAGKRLRSLIRLCRDELGDDLYRSANTLVRDQGRRLSHARTSRVLVKTLDALEEESAIDEGHYRVLRPALEERHAHALAELRADTAGRNEATEALAGLADCIAAVPAPAAYAEQDLAALLPAVHRSYRAARKTMRAARDIDSAFAFHEWRKRVNHLRYQMEALSGCCGPEIGGIADALAELSEALGDDHDLADLWRSSESIGDVASDELLQILLARSRPLRRQALEAAEVLFAEKPGRFVAFVAGHLRPRP